MVGTKAAAKPAAKPAAKAPAQPVATGQRRKSGIAKLKIKTPKDFARARRIIKAERDHPIRTKRKAELQAKFKRRHTTPSSYPTQSKKRKVLLYAKKLKQRTPKLRDSITPGTILILLAGRLRGRRVVFLGQLPSGLLLVTGPYKFNGVPIRRVNQAYVMATKTKVDISKVKLPDVFDKVKETKYFARVKQHRTKKTTEEIFSEKKEEYKPSEQKKTDQKNVDKQVIDAVLANSKANLLRGYLKTLFSLGKRDYPHQMIF
ncbi:60S ribosomal protein L6 [Cichlidogyrus casuarinus]|uniref:Large ribosomal subunit protein eL6 n=1 Tax=Cichlidogyrus casuarinus TaxID=1844966 RepID=A0ABD2QK40_9PLAT